MTRLLPISAAAFALYSCLGGCVSCVSYDVSLDLSAELNDDSTALTINWETFVDGDRGEDLLTELQLVRCSEELGCPQNIRDLERIEAGTVEWRAYWESVTEGASPHLAGPLTYPDGVGEFVPVGAFAQNGAVNSPIPAPALIPGASYALVARAREWQSDGFGERFFEIPQVPQAP